MHSWVTIAVPFDGARAPAVRTALEAMGNPAKEDVRKALGSRFVIHFVSAGVIEGAPGKRAHIVIEANSDLSATDTIVYLAAVLAPWINPALQAARMAELASISEQCDGLRCDMAMLLLPEVFQRSWGLTPAPFWPKAIAAVRQAHPGFTFLAETYWDLEWELQQEGFDYCYDKRLYDRLRASDGVSIRAHLAASLDYQDRLARFLENHDEPRAAASFPWQRHQAAAIVTFFVPGLRFFHQGQLDGAHVHLPVHLRRGPLEAPNPDIAAFYDRLLAVLSKRDAFRHGVWSLIPPEPAWAGNPTWQDFIAYAWHGPDGGNYVAIVNYSDHLAQCHLRLPFTGLTGNTFRLTDVMGSEVYDRDGNGLIDPGLYIDLGPWRYNLFRLERVWL